MNVIYPGTFDPPTKGHLNIIERGAKLFDRVDVAVGIDTEKKGAIFTQEERLLFLKTLTKNMANVEVHAFDGLLANFAKEQEANFIIRSLRTYTDFEHEKTLAHTNQKLSGIETLFLLPDEAFQSISSTIIRDIAKRGERLTPFIPEAIEKEVFEKLRGELR
ncbi:MAG: pantetheine-phosphate adenylyltransferase [Simkaniaceae bacterium]|jgi:pantetheine-phosphate adenylyltransferase|nr:MAG: pantetheine-phosphate adenylyltransferase [Simkaniaceae bacterium]